MNRLANAAGFQAGWWAAVGGASLGLEAAALAFGALLVVAHLATCGRPAQEAALAARALLLGVAVDSALQHLGVISFRGWPGGPLSPAWLWMLWVLFALTLNSSLAFLRSWHWGLSALAGAVFGPLSYLAGARLGAATFDATPLHVAALSAAWMVILPIMVAMARTPPARKATPRP